MQLYCQQLQLFIRLLTSIISVLQKMQCFLSVIPTFSSYVPLSQASTNYNPFMKSLTLLLLFSLEIFIVRADHSNCTTVQSAILGSTCTYCQSPTNMGCNKTFIDGTIKTLSINECINECCNTNYYTNTIIFPLCNNPFTPNSNSSSTLSLATILIIIFFSIPAGICLLIAICTCISNHHRTEQARDEPHLSAINLAAFNLDELGPLYQDRTQSCSICLEADCNVRTRCGHCYHSQCLKAWIHKKQKCPLCVTQDFNPIILYCMKCFKQIKLVLLIDNLSPEEALEWSKHGESKCDECLKDHLDDVISLDFSMPSEKEVGNKSSKIEEEKRAEIQKSQSHAMVAANI